ncbi:hypothetical protein [Alishewanella longhuensis]
MHSELDQLTTDFQQYFKVEHAIVINVVSKDGPLPDEATFLRLSQSRFYWQVTSASLI